MFFCKTLRFPNCRTNIWSCNNFPRAFLTFTCSYDGDSVENTEDALDKSKTWSRSIEDLHRGGSFHHGGTMRRGGTLPPSTTGNGITRIGRNSTLRYVNIQRWPVNLFLCLSWGGAVLLFVVPSVWPKPWDYFEKSHISYDESAAPLCSHEVCKTLKGLGHMQWKECLFYPFFKEYFL